MQELPERFKSEGATGWLRTYLESSSSADAGGNALPTEEPSNHQQSISRKSDFLSKVFRDVRVHTLFLPATTREQLRDLSRLGWNELTEEFRTEIGDLRRHLLSGLEARQSGGRATTGPTLARAMQFIVRGLQKGMFHELPSIWGTWASQVASVSLSDAEAWFSALTQRLDAGETPVSISTFNDRLDEARDAATKFYRALLRDFDVRPEVAELRRRMDVLLNERLLPAYYERIRRWVAERTAACKQDFATQLADLVLPTEPAIFERNLSDAADLARRRFAAELSKFSSSAERRSASSIIGGGAGRVQMPAFNPDPATQLSADLRAMLGARSLENERAVQHLFKQAVAAADEAITRELRSVSGGVVTISTNAPVGSETIPAPVPLLSRGRLTALRQLTEQRCWRAFEDRLAAYAWAPSVSHYKANRALVQSELLQARFSAFAATNEQRLKAFFSAQFDRAMTGYLSNRSTIVMPAAEADVEAEHAQLAAWAQEVLTGALKDLMDSDAFGEVRARLDNAMREGLQQAREKNIEVWKAYSDEATRCAVAANRARESQCGWFCLFNNVPWSHQATSRRHLNDCLAKSTVGSRMAATLRGHVFDAWYRKDIHSEAQRVWMRFYAILTTFAALIIGGWWRMTRRPQIAWTQPGMYCPPSVPQYYGKVPPTSGYGSYGQEGTIYGLSARAAAASAGVHGHHQPSQRRFSFFRGGA